MTGITLGIWLLAALAPPARATVLKELGLAELTRLADRVVVAKVEARRSRWEAGRIVTDVVLMVEDSAKGDARPGDRVVVTTLGGSVNGIGMRVIGEAAFVQGETALVFMQGGKAGMQVVGMAQGRLPVSLDAAGVRTVRADLGGAHLLVKDRRGRSVVTPALGLRLAGRPLADVVAEVRALVKQ